MLVLSLPLQSDEQQCAQKKGALLRSTRLCHEAASAEAISQRRVAHCGADHVRLDQDGDRKLNVQIRNERLQLLWCTTQQQSASSNATARLTVPFPRHAIAHSRLLEAAVDAMTEGVLAP